MAMGPEESLTVARPDRWQSLNGEPLEKAKRIRSGWQPSFRQGTQDQEVAPYRHAIAALSLSFKKR
jgi:hypothetical protein